MCFNMGQKERAKTMNFNRLRNILRKFGLPGALLLTLLVLISNEWIWKPWSSLKYKLLVWLKGNVVAEVNGYKMLLQTSRDSGLSRELYIHRFREVAATDYIRDRGLMKEGDAVVDIGANLGYYALLESRLVGESGMVYAIEPVSHNYETLLRNVNLNRFQNVECYRTAIGDHNGTAPIYLGRRLNWSSLTYSEHLGHNRNETVNVTTLDKFLVGKRNPSFIRMDVEGHEYAIIEGAKETLKGDVSIFMEIHPPLMKVEQMIGMLETLRKLGYREAVALPMTTAWWLLDNRVFTWLDSRIAPETKKLRVLTIDELERELVKYNHYPHVFLRKK